MWATILGGGVLVLSVILFLMAREFIATVVNDVFHLTREQFNFAAFFLLGFIEVLFWMLFMVPYLALVIVG